MRRTFLEITKKTKLNIILNQMRLAFKQFISKENNIKKSSISSKKKKLF
jgi:hypothetical protein